MNIKLIFLAIAMSYNFAVIAQTTKTEKLVYNTERIANDATPEIDGIMDDKAWDLVEWNDNFTQYRPSNGEKPSQNTKFKIIYDDTFIYFGARCYDSSPDSIVKRLSRRDGFEGDWINVSFDSYHDLRSCYSYNVTVAGVKGDEFLSNDGGNSDENYNPIWYTKTTVDEEGWVAEMKIPLSQLRFIEAEDQVWGLQVMRKLFRKEERSAWQHVTLDQGGWISNYGELHGLKNLKPKRQIEIQPYLVAKTERFTSEEGNPFRTGEKSDIIGGLDAKIGISNAMTLDLTINPDFGQVEADPAAITLDGFQIFFREQRPFFVENRNIFDYAVSSSAAGNTFGNDNLFYSRRIGKNPSGYPNLSNGENASIPQNTTILGAAKISGRTSNGWSLGILETMTNTESASIDLNGTRRSEIIEPLTNYFVARAQKDFNDANTTFGGIFTSTIRKKSENLPFLHHSATTGGMDFRHRWNDRSWSMSGNIVTSHVEGSQESILGTQNSIRHLFQRVDADHLDVDTTLTSLTGTGGSFKIGKEGNGRLIFQSGITWRSPELELNDLGFQRQADDIRHFNWTGYRWREPFSIFRSLAVNYNHWLIYDFEGNRNGTAWNINTSANFKNNWWGGTGTNLTPYNFSNSELRGGPRFRSVPSANNWFWLDSDGRKKVQYGINFTHGGSTDKASRFYNRYAWIRYRPINPLSITMSGEYNNNFNNLQYVTNLETESNQRYIQARIDQETLAASLRLNYTINPNLTLQYYGQPFITKGTYSHFKSAKNFTSKFYSDKFDEFTGEQINLSEDNESYAVDENLDGVSDYSFGNPDFTFFQFRSNLVLRWEYRPGSEIYLVWSQGNVQFANDDRKLVGRVFDEFSNKNLENIFLLKATYRLSL